MNDTASRPPAQGMEMLAQRPYRPRHLRFIRRQDIGDWRMKVYAISLLGQTARPELVEATMGIARQVLPKDATANERTGIGFVVVHDALTASIGIVYWWASVNELHQRMFVGPKHDPKQMAKLAEPGAGCVYELGIVDFERRAWLEDVLANPAGPDLDLYLSRRFDADI